MSQYLWPFHPSYTPMFHFNNGAPIFLSTVLSSIFPEKKLESLIDQTSRVVEREPRAEQR